MKMKLMLLFSMLLVSGVSSLPAEGTFYGDLSWSPQVSDYIWMSSNPDNHTIKRSFLGFNLNTDYIFGNGIGAGQETQWGMVDRLTMRSGNTKYVVDDSFGSYYYVRFSPQFLYTPLLTEHQMISLGIGPSITLFYLLSEYGDSFGEYTSGISMKMRYRWFYNDHLFFNAGLGVTVEFISFGHFVEKIFSDFIQLQVSPVIGAGIRF